MLIHHSGEYIVMFDWKWFPFAFDSVRYAFDVCPCLKYVFQLLIQILCLVSLLLFLPWICTDTYWLTIFFEQRSHVTKECMRFTKDKSPLCNWSFCLFVLLTWKINMSYISLLCWFNSFPFLVMLHLSKVSLMSQQESMCLGIIWWLVINGKPTSL